jgi:hypothetical protein
MRRRKPGADRLDFVKPALRLAGAKLGKRGTSAAFSSANANYHFDLGSGRFHGRSGLWTSEQDGTTRMRAPVLPGFCEFAGALEVVLEMLRPSTAERKPSSRE